ncbi:Putative 2EXR domain-containing protein [Colletotrichum destructivum]|uniref:2EXR domain-containing protein n=1 Tax=Colletotrichum destructivum TaxID=34406 RepID=A0AAX4IQN7_9PEZI|nr:Putative 2EXR domain-containing protein [Colletotrichum destructivum]
MATTFHQFSSLPPEIRILIWECALRPSHPGVHFFSLETKAIVTESVGRRRPSVVPRDTRYILAPPAFTTGPRRMWQDGNPSTYLVDAGLWSAQRESRHVVQKHLNQLLKPHSPGDARDATGPDQQQPGGTLRMLPHQDLICIQVGARQNVMTDKALSDLRTMLQRPSPTAKFSTTVHIAFEYDDSWAISGEGRLSLLRSEAGPKSCFLHLLNSIYLGKLSAELYLIDYRLKLKPGVLAPCLFRADGYEFRGVDRSRVEGGDGASSIWGFVRALNQIAALWWMSTYMLPWGSELDEDTQPWNYFHRHHASVLVCQKE